MWTYNCSNELSHHGILGMHWGHRKPSDSTASTLSVKTKGITVREDGSIDVEKGASVQRLVRGKGGSLPLKNLTYASLTDYDNAKYIKYIGGKGFFGGGRDTIVKLAATQKIKAPSVDEATRITSDLFVNDSKFRKTFTDSLARPAPEEDIVAMKKDPTGKVAKMWYTQVNTALTFSPDFDETAPYIQKTVRESFVKKGFNAVRDENDFQSGVSKAPIIIFSPEKTLKVTTVSTITDELRAASKEKVKQYKALGSDWVNKSLYQ